MLRHAWLIVALATSASYATEPTRDVFPIAVLRFQERGSGAEGYGDKVTELVFAALVADPDLYLVDREDLRKTLQEQQLSLSGLVQPEQAVQVGQLCGARIIVTGSVIEAGNKLYLVAKIIGTETSRVLGASVKGDINGELAPLAEELSKQVGKTIREQATQLVAKPPVPADQIAAIREAIAGAALPSICIDVEERHIGQPSVDPAAESEISRVSGAVGFSIIDANNGGRQSADVLIEGQGFSEIAGRHSDMVTVKARLEIKAIDRASGKVIATDRETVIVVDLAEQVAGKSALEQAAARIARRLLPKLASK